jgi:acetyltransferase-like isoleucine patch superfamily enzyme
MLRKLFNKAREVMARKRLAGQVNVGANTSINYRLISIRKDCKVRVGTNSIIECSIAFDRGGSSVYIGDRTFIGGDTRLVCADRIIIGDDVLISWGCTIVDHNSHSVMWSERKQDVLQWMNGRKDWSFVKTGPVVIKQKVWIGFNSIILKGIIVGEGAIIAAGSVVTKDVLPYTIVAGNPAGVVRELTAEEH